MARGKKKKDTTPARPAAVSGPGALSRRTDGGPAAPVYASPEGERPYGERKAIEAQASGADMAGRGAVDPRLAATVQRGVFGATERPDQPPTAGAPFGPGRTPGISPVEDDVDLMLRAVLAEFPHPDIERLLQRRG